MFDSAPFVFRLTITATLIALGQPASAATVNLDGKEHKRLSDAVQAAITADDGPHVVNITTDELPLADTGFTISEPITINGDADGNGKKCDILVDIAGIRRQPTSETRSQKCYIEIISEGAVEINDLQIHPDADASAMSDDQLVDAIRVYCPPKKVDVSHYTLNRVWISGSDSDNAFIPLTSFDNLFAREGIKMWGRQVRMSNRGIIHTANRKSGPRTQEQRGSYNLTLNECQ